MKQRMLAIAAGAILVLSCGITYAATDPSSDPMNPNMSVPPSNCATDQKLCVNGETMRENQPSQSDADVGLRLGEQEESMQEESMNEDQDTDQANDTEEHASSDNESRGILIIVR